MSAAIGYFFGHSGTLSLASVLNTLIGTALIGDWLLHTLSISLPAFRIAGGLLLFSIASEMVFGVRSRHEGEAAEQAMEERVRNVAAFPLAIPLLAGPGAIAATVLLAGRADGDWSLLGVLLAIEALVADVETRRPRATEPAGAPAKAAITLAKFAQRLPALLVAAADALVAAPTVPKRSFAVAPTMAVDVTLDLVE